MGFQFDSIGIEAVFAGVERRKHRLRRKVNKKRYTHVYPFVSDKNENESDRIFMKRYLTFFQPLIFSRPV
jgi:hypothetical protein